MLSSSATKKPLVPGTAVMFVHFWLLSTLSTLSTCLFKYRGLRCQLSYAVTFLIHHGFANDAVFFKQHQRKFFVIACQFVSSGRIPQAAKNTVHPLQLPNFRRFPLKVKKDISRKESPFNISVFFGFTVSLVLRFFRVFPSVLYLLWIDRTATKKSRGSYGDEEDETICRKSNGFHGYSRRRPNKICPSAQGRRIIPWA